MSVFSRSFMPVVFLSSTAVATLCCNGDHPTSATPEVRTVLSVAGIPVPEAEMRARLVRMTQLVARALSDRSARSHVFAQLHASPYREHKLHFAPFLSQQTNPLLERMAALRGTTARALLAELDSLFDLEFYMPVRNHWVRWTGGPDLIVASAIEDHEIPVAFDLQGAPVVLTSAEEPPATPTLSLVPSETDFSTIPAKPNMMMYCGEECGGGGGGAGGGAYTPPPPSPGIYMTYSYLADLHEGFLRGSPEIEVCLIARSRLSGTAAVTQAGICANEGGGTVPPGVAPSPGNRIFDQNDHAWTASYPGVMVASKAELDSIAALYPGVPRDSVPFMLQIWEDDTDRGIIYDPDNEYNTIVGTHAMLAGALLIGPGANGAWVAIAFGAGLELYGFEHFLSGVVNLFTGANDDFVGFVVDAHALLQTTGIPTSTTHAVMKGTAKVGEVQLTYIR